jgi:hypothetical protein
MTSRSEVFETNDSEKKLETLRKALKAIADIYLPGTLAWAEENSYQERLGDLMRRIDSDFFQTSYEEYRRILENLYLLFRDEIIPSYKGQAMKKVKEAVDGKTVES